MSEASELNIQEILNKKARRKSLLANILPFSGLVFIFVFFLIVTNGRILNASNIANLISQVFTVAVVAVGATFVYAHGGMDFSIGGSAGLAMLVGASLIVAGQPVWLVIPMCIATSMLCSLIVGASARLLQIPVFVVSLCVRSICVGILNMSVMRGDIAINFSKFKEFNSIWLKLPILLTIIGIGFYLFEYTGIGKSEKAIGGNILTTIQGGIRINVKIIFAYLTMGACVGLAAFFLLTRTGKVLGTSGSGLEFDIMTALVLGGFPLMGGSRARFLAAIVGAFTVTLLSNGLILWGLEYYLIGGIKGLLFLAVIALSYDRSSIRQLVLY